MFWSFRKYFLGGVSWISIQTNLLNSEFHFVLNCGQPRKIHKSHKKWAAGLLVQDYSRADYVDWIQVEYYVIALILKIHLSRSKTKIRVHYLHLSPNGAQMAFTAFCDATLNCSKNIFRQFYFKEMRSSLKYPLVKTVFESDRKYRWI